jgi:hypothetical protein
MTDHRATFSAGTEAAGFNPLALSGVGCSIGLINEWLRKRK